MHQALYRKWRSRTFDDVWGQDHVTSILRYEIDHGTFSHAYLFCGSRGTGKTTCAKIMAKAVNCEHPVNGSPCNVCAACRSVDSGAATDVLELDAASNNGVDNVRDIRDEVVYAPNALKYRVYIIDEVHMLSGSAFNALLKTLEEPPAHVVFILATTELQKLPATIISRCQRFDFRRIASPVIARRLAYIAENEKITLDPEAALVLAKLAQGGMRDAISLLELCAGSQRPITPELVNEVVGISGRESIFGTLRAIADRNFDALYGEVARVVESSLDLGVFWQDLISVYRDMLIYKTARQSAGFLDLTDTENQRMREICGRFSRETILYHLSLLESAYLTMNSAASLKRVTAELTLTRLCDENLSTSNEALLARVARLEEAVASGGYAPRIPASGGETVTAEKTAAAPADAIPRELPQNSVCTSGDVAAIPSAESAGAPENPVPRTAPASADGQKILRPLRQWGEVLERVAGRDGMVASFLQGAKAFLTPDGAVHVRMPDAFACSMVEKNEGRPVLCSALSVVLHREIGERDMVLEQLPPTETGCALDEILEEIAEASAEE